LTLKQHEEGIWIRRLVQALKNHHAATTTSEGMIEIQVKSLETWLGQGWIVSNDCCLFENNVVGIVNRVSDAAPPALFKLCCAVLGAAQSLQIPIVNGPTTYSLCANKWCHHVLFRQAKLSSPSTIAYYWNDANTELPQQQPLEQLSLPQTLLREDGDSMLLIKPNAGGFGAGIRRVSSLPENLPRFDDNVTLLQQYVPPRDKKLYRVWFLRGKVQCAVERSIVDESTEFTAACAAGGTCSAARPKLEAWKVPEDVQEELERQLLPLLIDAHCGSVEFLYSEEEQAQQRLYFDLNLLSTLPVNVSDPNNVWSKDYDPWKELAAAVWAIVD
jgi:hypothetical protein